MNNYYEAERSKSALSAGQRWPHVGILTKSNLIPAGSRAPQFTCWPEGAGRRKGIKRNPTYPTENPHGPGWAYVFCGLPWYKGLWGGKASPDARSPSTQDATESSGGFLSWRPCTLQGLGQSRPWQSLAEIRLRSQSLPPDWEEPPLPPAPTNYRLLGPDQGHWTLPGTLRGMDM